MISKQKSQLMFFQKTFVTMLIFVSFSQLKSSHASYGAISDKVIPSCFALETSQPVDEALRSGSKSSLTSLLASHKSLPAKNGLVRNKKFTNLDAYQAKIEMNFNPQSEIEKLSLANLNALQIQIDTNFDSQSEEEELVLLHSTKRERRKNAMLDRRRIEPRESTVYITVWSGSRHEYNERCMYQSSCLACLMCCTVSIACIL